MKFPGQRSPHSFRRIVAAATATGAVVVGVVGLGSIAGAATDASGHDADGMASHESMMDGMEMMGGVPMGRMHGEMMSSSADMRRMHAHMMSRHPDMREMHAEMVSDR